MKNLIKTFIVMLLLCLTTFTIASCDLFPINPPAPQHTHELTEVAEVSATCTEAGAKAYYKCSGCEKLFADKDGAKEITAPEAIAALGHSFTNYASNNDATCTADGTKTAKCDRCDATDTKADEGSAKGHDYTEKVVDEAHLKAVAEDCQSVNTYWYDCTKCDSISSELSFNSDIVGNHKMSTDWSTKDGKHFHECTVDGCDYTEDEAVCSDVATDDNHLCDTCGAPAGDHSYGEWTNAGDDGHKQTCNCGDVKTEAHAWNETSKTPATHIEEGKIDYSCNCGATRTVIIGKLEECKYNVEKVADQYLKSAATCTSAEVYYKSCVCGAFSSAEDAETFEFGEALGHSYGEASYAWGEDYSCTATRVCAKDASHKETVTATVTSETTAATCKEAGKTVYTATFDGEAYTTQITSVELPKLDTHTEGQPVEENRNEASCLASGSYDSVVYCSVCGVQLKKETITIDALGHKYDNDKDTDCNACGATRIVKLSTPDNSDNKLFYSANATYIEIDRAVDGEGARVSMFQNGVDHVIFYVYESADAAKEDYVARFALQSVPVNIGRVNFTSLDGTLSVNALQGENGNFFIHKNDYTIFYNFLKDLIGYNYSYGQSYYFAAQAIAAEDSNYENSDISEIGADAFVRDASKGNEKYTVTVTDGLIDSSLTSVTAGYGVELTLSTEAQDDKVFKGWYLIDAEGNEIGEALTAELMHTVTVTGNASYKAVFVTEKTKIATPDNSDSKPFYLSSTGYIEIDRAVDGEGARVSMFQNGVDHVIFYVYESADAAKDNYVARFALKGTPVSIGIIDFTSIDGTVSANVVRGQNGNYYIDKGEQNSFYTFLRTLIGYNYSYGQTYYFAAQAIAAEGTAYENSDISEIGADGFARDVSKGNERYTVTVADGLIDSSLTSVTAGYGIELTLSTEAQEGKFFKGWYLTDADGNEIGETLSADLTYTVTVTASASYKAVFASEKIKLATIDNTNNEMITFVKTNTFYIELDRHKNADGTANTAYDVGVDYVRYYMYRDFEGTKQLVSWFDVTKDGYLIDYNGNKNSQQLLGGTGNFFSTMGNGTWHNAIKSSYNQGAAANGLAVVWDNDNVVYFACQARTNNTDSYEHGEIGTMGQAWGSI